MCNLIHNGIKCNDVYLQRCFNHLKLLTFIEKFKISEINIISSGCRKNYMEYGILEKKKKEKKTGYRVNSLFSVCLSFHQESSIFIRNWLLVVFSLFAPS